MTSMSEARVWFAVAHSTREIIVCGGWNNGFLRTCEVFQAARERWIPMSDLENSRRNFSVVWLRDGRIFAFGGNNSDCCLSSVEMQVRDWTFEGITKNPWRQVAHMLTARSHFASVALRDNTILVAGGNTHEMVWLSTVHCFHPPAKNDLVGLGQWVNIQPMLSSPSTSCSGVISAGIVFIFESKSSKIRRFRPSGRFADNAESQIENWIWDEEVSLNAVDNWVLSTTFK